MGQMLGVSPAGWSLHGGKWCSQAHWHVAAIPLKSPSDNSNGRKMPENPQPNPINLSNKDTALCLL